MARSRPRPARPLARCLGAAALVAAAALGATQDGPQERTSAEQIRAYFQVCDADGNGWISYREARNSLGIDRELYARLDADRDGRVTPEEFEARFAHVADRVGYLPPTRTPRSEIVDLPREPQQLLMAYDTSGDGGLDEGEVEILLFDYGRSEIPAALALERLDENADGSLREGELELLSRLIATLYVAGPGAAPRENPPASISDLFGKPIERPGGLDRTPQPPLIVGPVPIFRRLDEDDDGGIEVDDLRALLSPLQLGVSLPAIHATIDVDEDGRIDPDELDLALGARR